MGKVMKSLFVAAVIGILGVVVAFLVIQIVKAPKLSEIEAAPEGYLSTILNKDGTAINTLYVTESNRIYVGLENLPEDLQEAFIAIEDARFYSHHGVDPQGMIRAFVHGIKNGGFTQGGSTITQQLLKNNVFTGWMNEQTFYEKLCRKVQEQFLAIRLEQQYTKEWILESYLNTINLGQNTLGVQAASKRYFGKSVAGGFSGGKNQIALHFGERCQHKRGALQGPGRAVPSVTALRGSRIPALSHLR